MTRLGTAVIGLGVGLDHLRAYARLPEGELVAICNQNPDRLGVAGAESGVTTYAEADAQAIQAGREPLVNGEEGRKSIELMLAIYQSSRTGEAVRLPLGQ